MRCDVISRKCECENGEIAICGPTDLDAYRGSGAATRVARAKLLTDLRGGGKVAVVGGRSGIVLSWESELRGKTGCHAGLRFEECTRQHALFCFIPGGRHIRTSNRASRGNNYYENCVRVRIRQPRARPARPGAVIESLNCSLMPVYLSRSSA
jgi:hypothetical protein